jgi:dimethylhistidine N-methyltransferase
VARVSPAATLIELGSGSAAKTRLLIDALLRRQERLRYVPVDISRSALEDSARALLAAYPALHIDAVAAEYQDGWRHLAGRDVLTAGADASRLLLWLGSNIGNLARGEAAAFLRRVRETMGPRDRLLVGIDLRKDPAVLQAAYDDARGVTARFNKNLLVRINRELGGRCNVDSFTHRAVYHEADGRITMELVSTHEQVVSIEALQLRLPFAAGEAIHTEDSYKYSDGEIRALASAGGFVLEYQWLDSGRRFADALLRPAPAS